MISILDYSAHERNLFIFIKWACFWGDKSTLIEISDWEVFKLGFVPFCFLFPFRRGLVSIVEDPCNLFIDIEPIMITVSKFVFSRRLNFTFTLALPAPISLLLLILTVRINLLVNRFRYGNYLFLDKPRLVSVACQAN